MRTRTVNPILSAWNIVLQRDNIPVQLCMKSAGAGTDYLQAFESTCTMKNGKRASLD